MTPSSGLGKTQSHDGSKLRIAIVHARWNTEIISALVSGARESLSAAGVKEANIVVQDVPGSYELPLAIQRVYKASQHQSSRTVSPHNTIPELATNETSAAKASDAEFMQTSFDAMIAIGVLIKGETMHFEYIADATSHGLMRVQLDLGIPVIFGLLTVLTEEQGRARAGLTEDGHCHGKDWGNAAVELSVKSAAWAQGSVF